MTVFLALTAWPVFVIAFFRRMVTSKAILVAIIGGYLLLPTQFGLDLPLLPLLDKHSIPVLMAVFMVYVLGLHKSSDVRRPAWSKPDGRAVLLGALLLIGGLGATLTNTSPLIYGPLVVPAMRLYDYFSLGLSTIIMLLPLLLARRFISRPEDHVMALRILCIAGLAYSALAMIEVRLSPQLNVWIYGFFPNDWIQHLRRDGFRPIIFLEHGLFVGIFFSCTILAAAGLWRIGEGQDKTRWGMAVGWLLITLFLSKTLGAFMITLVILPVILFFPTRMQLMTAAVIATAFLAYPMLRGVGAIPTQTVVGFVETINPQRASSFQYRLDNEDRLLARAQERPLFGWGIWGRARIYNDKGQDISVTDGYWIIAVGELGWIGYVGQFGLLAGPIILLAMRSRQYNVGPETAALSLVLSANIIDLIPNAGISPVTWLMSGMLWGRYELGNIGFEATKQNTTPIGRQLRYTRSAERGPENGLPENPRPALSYSRSPEALGQKGRGRKLPG